MTMEFALFLSVVVILIAGAVAYFDFRRLRRRSEEAFLRTWSSSTNSPKDQWGNRTPVVDRLVREELARTLRPKCPTCGSTSENWRPERDYCADCGRGVRVGASRDSLAAMFFAGQIDEQQLTAMALASGLSARDIVDILDDCLNRPPSSSTE